MTSDDELTSVVTVIRLVPLRRADGTGEETAIVASFESASMRREGDAIFLLVRDAATLGRLKVGDIIHWVAEPLGVVWRAEHVDRVGCADSSPAHGGETHQIANPGSAEDQQCGG